MSFPATAPRAAAPEPARRARSILLSADPATAELRAGAGLAIAFAAVAFVTTGGTSLAPNTWEEIVLLLVGWLAAAAALLTSGPARRWGAVTLVTFAALTALTAASIAWSVQPAQSWVEADRAVSYLALFGLAIAGGRRLAGGWPAVVGGLSTFFALVSSYALLSKVFPAALDQLDFLGRLSTPFDYWNATGVAAAMGLPLAVWTGARADRTRRLRALSVPMVSIELTALILSYSRSAVLAAVLGLLVWFALVPLRLRGAMILAAGAAGGAILSAWALSTPHLIGDNVSLPERASAGEAFGLVLLLVLVVLLLAGLAIAFSADRLVLPPRRRRQAGRALVAVVALVPAIGLLALATSRRGFGGEVSHIYSTLTSTQEHVGDQASRLVQLGNSRPLYWSEGLKVAGHNLLHGAGVGGYATARTRYSSDPLPVGHAHSYLIETLADLGIAGLLVNLALLIAWSLACCRTFGVHLSPAGRRGRALRAAVDPVAAADRGEHAALGTLLAVVFAFGVQSLVDWTWFIPGVALPALFCAGWLAGRGPLAEHVTRARRLDATAHPIRLLALTLGGVVTLLVAWIIAQPLRAQQAQAASLNAAVRGNGAAALAEARTAASADPLSVEPLFQLAALYDALGARHQAHAALVSALRVQPDNPQTWIQLGTWDLQHGLPHASIGVLERAYHLDLPDTAILQEVSQAHAEALARRRH